MDLGKMLTSLHTERCELEVAIIALERLVSGQPKQRGRPPKWMSRANETQGRLGNAPPKKIVRSEGGKRMAAAG
jgi:hypothetical protein